MFVDPAWFGHGLAADLLERAVTEMQRQGYRAARLDARRPAPRTGVLRARGLVADGREMFDKGLGLALVELGREVGTDAPVDLVREKDIPGTTGFDAVGSLGWLRVEVPEAS